MDPYANAFNHTPHPARHVDETNYLSPYVWERKYEVDSLCYPLWLALKYYGVTNDLSIFDDGFFKAFGTVINTFETEQEHDEKSPYYFRRTGPYASDTLDNGGKGALTARCGLTWSAFRPSDDRCVYHYLIPANIMAASVLNRLSAIILKAFPIESALAKRAEKLAESINRGIEKHGIILHPEFGKMYAYEVDGRGNYLLMDDANVPSLLSLPYLECLDSDDPIYQNTRKFVLSKSNPYFYKGKAAEGIGSPHTPDDYIWHIGIVIRLLTSTDRAEMKACFDMLINTDGGKGLMHESFDKDNPEKFTREWFGWANTLFGLATHKMLKEGFKI